MSSQLGWLQALSVHSSYTNGLLVYLCTPIGNRQGHN